MNSKKYSVSISSQITANRVKVSLISFLAAYAAAAAALICCWCVLTELDVCGSIIPGIPRGFSFPAGKTFFGLFGVVYRFGEYEADAGKAAVIAAVITAAAIIAEAVSVMALFKTGRNKAARMLRPIRKLTSAIEERVESYRGDSFGTAAGAEPVGTGNADLAQLESAVNMLIGNINDSYGARDRFVSDASHELRTPIAVIKGYSDMLARWGKSDEKILDEAVTAIRNESDHIGKLVEQMLFLTRGEMGKQPYLPDVFSISGMMKEIISEYTLIDPKHKYVADIQGDFFGLGDSTLLKQAIRILTDNAMKYTDEGGEIILFVHRNVQSEVLFGVQDNSIGIEKGDIEHLFDRFYRSDESRNRGTGGSGLGLSIAKWIVDRHGGRFDISSCVGIGTRIAVVLPKLSPGEEDFVLDEKKPERSRRIGGRSILINRSE